nr:hypothetical protein Iba_chr03eCG2060 [Ipomoea batatas]
MNSIVVGPNLEIVLSSEERKKFELGKSKLKFGVRECVDLGELEKSVLSEIRIAEVEHELLSGLHFAFLVGLSADGGGGGRARTSSSESGGGAHREIRREISHESQFHSDSTSVQMYNTGMGGKSGKKQANMSVKFDSKIKSGVPLLLHKFGVRECVDLGELEKSVLSEIRIAEVEHELLSGLHFAFLVGLSADGGGGGRARTSSSESGGGAHREIRREISHESQFHSDSTSVQMYNTGMGGKSGKKQANMSVKFDSKIKSGVPLLLHVPGFLL